MDIGVYARLSYEAEDDGENATPTDRQVAECLRFAELKGWHVQRVYRDEGRSAYKGAPRPQFEAMLADAADGAIVGVLTWKLDRLSRNRRDWGRLMDLCDDGLILASVTESLDSSTAAGRAMRDILAVFARMESENISLRTQAAFAAQAREGKPRRAGRRPFGREDDRTTPHPTEAAELADLAQRLLGGESIRALTIDLNRRGWRTVFGNEWTTSAVRRVLLQPANAGDLVHRGAVVARGVMPAIVDRATHEEVVALLSHPGRRSHPGHPKRYLLVGLAVCWCGNKLSSRPDSDGKRRYICRTFTADKAHVHLSVTGDPLEDHVTRMALKVLDGPGLAKARAATSDPATAELARSVADDEARLAQLRHDYYEEGLLERPEYLDSRRQLTDQIARKRARLDRAAESRVLAGLPTGDALRKAWKTWSLDHRAAVLAALLEAVVVLPAPRGRRGGRALDPDRVVLEWRL